MQNLIERNLEIMQENERLKQELDSFKKKANTEYRKLWNDNQMLLQKLNMVAEFTNDHYQILPHS